jgi:hypothetical protein
MLLRRHEGESYNDWSSPDYLKLLKLKEYLESC